MGGDPYVLGLQGAIGRIIEAQLDPIGGTMDQIFPLIR